MSFVNCWRQMLSYVILSLPHTARYSLVQALKKTFASQYQQNLTLANIGKVRSRNFQEWKFCQPNASLILSKKTDYSDLRRAWYRFWWNNWQWSGDRCARGRVYHQCDHKYKKHEMTVHCYRIFQRIQVAYFKCRLEVLNTNIQICIQSPIGNTNITYDSFW